MVAIIGDVHGCIKTLKYLLERLFKHYNLETIVFAGDLIDRGADSKKVIELIRNLKRHINVICCLGNHEDMMIDFLLNERRYDKKLWLDNNGLATLKSFLGNRLYKKFKNRSLKPDKTVKPFGDYLDFFLSLPEYHIIELESKKLFISHAGVEFFNLDIDEQYKELPDNLRKIKHPFIWSRNTDYEENIYNDYLIIHGHTPIKSLGLTNKFDYPYINSDSSGDIISINIDTGCIYGFALTAVIFNEKGEFDFEITNYRN